MNLIDAICGVLGVVNLVIAVAESLRSRYDRATYSLVLGLFLLWLALPR